MLARECVVSRVPAALLHSVRRNRLPDSTRLMSPVPLHLRSQFGEAHFLCSSSHAVEPVKREIGLQGMTRLSF